jgi:hypothetical protein
MRIVKVIESDVVVKSSRRNTIAAWLAQQYTRGRIEGEQVHSGGGGGGGGKRGVEKRGARKNRKLSDTALDVQRQLIIRKQRARVTRCKQRVACYLCFTSDEQ